MKYLAQSAVCSVIVTLTLSKQSTRVSNKKAFSHFVIAGIFINLRDEKRDGYNIDIVQFSSSALEDLDSVDDMALLCVRSTKKGSLKTCFSIPKKKILDS